MKLPLNENISLPIETLQHLIEIAIVSKHPFELRKQDKAR